MSKYHYVRKSITWDGHRYEVRGKTEMEAVERLSELLTSLQEGRVLRSGDTLVDIWYQEWKRVYKAPADLTRKSLQLYDEKYRKYISPAIGTLPLRDVHDVQLQSILNDQRGMSFSHVTKLRMVMQEMFRQAYRSRLIAFDPSVGLRLPKNVKTFLPFDHRGGTCTYLRGSQISPIWSLGIADPILWPSSWRSCRFTMERYRF